MRARYGLLVAGALFLALAGGPGPQTLNGGPGDDSCSGGPGRDIIKNCE